MPGCGWVHASGIAFGPQVTAPGWNEHGEGVGEMKRRNPRWACRLVRLLIAGAFVIPAVCTPASAGAEQGFYDHSPLIASGPVRLDVTSERASQLPPGWTYEEVVRNRQSFDPFWLVKFDGAVGGEHRRMLEAAGTEVVAYYPFNTFLVRLGDSRTKISLRELEGVMWDGPMEPLFKVSADLWEAVQSASTASVVGDGGWGLRLVVTLHEDPNEDRARADRRRIEAQLQSTPGVLRLLPTRGAIRLQAIADPELLEELLKSISGLSGVSGIGVWRKSYLSNDENVQVSQSGACIDGNEGPHTAIFNRGITGWGARLAVADSCTDANEGYYYDDALASLPPVENNSPWTSVAPNWSQRKIVEYYNMYSADSTIGCGGASGCSGTCPDHGNHVTGTICGNCSLDPEGIATRTNPANSDGDNDGMAPGAQLIAQDLDPNLGYLNSDGGDLGELVGVAYDNTCNAGDCGIDAHNNSWGNSSDAYSYDAQMVDRATFKTRREVTVLVANGNAGVPGCTYYSNCTADGYDTIGGPATAKNVIGVGSGEPCTANVMEESSSRGDTADGRLKPDVVATGEAVTSSRNDGNGSTNANGGCSTLTIAGTSMATPTATGLVGLIDQYFKDGFYPTGTAAPADSLDPSGMLSKAMLVNSGRRMTGAGASRDGTEWPNMDQGYGFAVLEDALHFPGDSRNLFVVDEATGVDVSGASTMTFSRRIVSGSEPLKVTLVWNDNDANISCSSCLINDLDLSVVDESTSTTYTVTRIASNNGNHLVPRTVVPSSPSFGQTTVDNGPDTLNNVEQIIVYNPTGGARFSFSVTAATTPDGPIPFALVVTGDTDHPCTPPGAVSDLTASVGGLNRIDLSWTPINTPIGTASAKVYRTLTPGGPYSLVAGNVTAGFYSDDDVSAGLTYYYRVTGLASDDCESLHSNEASATATGDCVAGPDFAGLSSAQALFTSNCGIRLTWPEATSMCPGGSVTYNIYREEAATAPVDPGPDSQIAREMVCGAGGACTCVSGTCTYDDYSAIADGGTYHYVVRAFDSESDMDDGNSVEHNDAAAGPLTPDQVIWSQDFQSCTGACGFGSADFGGTGTNSWKGVDGGCLTGSGAEYRFGGLSNCTSNYYNDNLYGRTAQVSIPANARNTRVSFSHTYEFEPGRWDSAILVLDTDAGSGFNGTYSYVNSFDQGGYAGLDDLCWGVDSWSESNWGTYTSTIATLDGVCSSDSGAADCGGLDLKIGWAACTDYIYTRNGWRIDNIEVRADLPGSCTTTPEAMDWLTATTRRLCVGGSNDGNACAVAGDCPSGVCSVANKMEWWPGDSGNVLVMGAAPPTWVTIPTYGSEACYGTGPAETYGFCTDDPGAARNYSSFTNTQADFGGAWSDPPLTISAPDPTALSARVAWVYSTEASSVAPVLLFGGSPGIYTVSNDMGHHSATRGASGGSWPAGGALHWRPSGMNGPSQQRPRVVDFTTAVPPASLGYNDRHGIPTSASVVSFVSGMDGAAYAFDAQTGDAIWRRDLTASGVGMLLSSPVVSVAGWGNVNSTAERVFVGTRDGGQDNEVFGLAVSDGAISDDWRYDNLSFGGNHTGDGGMGIVTGMMLDVFADPPRLYLTTRRRATTGSQHTLWAFDIESTAPHLRRAWSVDAGDCDGGPTMIGWTTTKKVVIGTNDGEIKTFVADDHTQTAGRDYSSGAVKGWVMYDHDSDRLVFSAGDTVFSIRESDLDDTTAPLTATVANASTPLPYDGRVYVGGDSQIQILNSTDLSPAAGSPVALPGAGILGMPTGDWNGDVLYVGATSGRIYAVEFF